ncbi:hypothetical protein [Archangium lipolyticum]|uniref:hypothetical protein n=1 Tax=Archangium lipolyticum TaxID=2970465 RepID=UPI00214A264A|nr:hypothetical protein [Archangium lipolyticum]
MPPGASFSFDDSQWPLMVVRLTGELSSQDFESYLSRASHYLQRQQRHVCIFDVSTLRLFSSEQRQRQVEWLKAHEVLIHQTLLGIAYVVTSPVVRLTMSVIFHLKTPSAPYTIVPDLGAAAAWAAACLDKTSLRPVAERIRSQFCSGREGDAVLPQAGALPRHPLPEPRAED